MPRAASPDSRWPGSTLAVELGLAAIALASATSSEAGARPARKLAHRLSVVAIASPGGSAAEIGDQRVPVGRRHVEAIVAGAADVGHERAIARRIERGLRLVEQHAILGLARADAERNRPALRRRPACRGRRSAIASRQPCDPSRRRLTSGTPGWSTKLLNAARTSRVLGGVRDRLEELLRGRIAIGVALEVKAHALA